MADGRQAMAFSPKPSAYFSRSPVAANLPQPSWPGPASPAEMTILTNLAN